MGLRENLIFINLLISMGLKDKNWVVLLRGSDEKFAFINLMISMGFNDNN